MEPRSDAIVVGGGVIGLSIAYELAGQGVAVAVLEQGQFGQEASWAGAGILPPGNPTVATEPEARLRGESCLLWPKWSAQLLDATGIDNGFRRCGGMEVTFDDTDMQLRAEVSAWKSEGCEVEELTPRQLCDYEPALTQRVTAAYRLPHLAQVRNPRHLKALMAGCAARGVNLVAGQPVIGFEFAENRVIAARTPSGRYAAGQFCIAGGAWSRQILSQTGCEIPVEPVRGQIVLLSAQPSPFRHVIQVGARYLVPRPDGRILVGSTEEWVGFEKRNTAKAVGELAAFAIELVPALSGARYERAWSGLRPGSPDGLPYLGRVPSAENLFVAAGHFRAGLQLSPATAVVVRQVMLGEPPSVPLEAFACDRGQSPVHA
jgi:glycine oxidase